MAEEGVVAQQALAEAVDGVDGGVVELRQRGLQAQFQPFGRFLPRRLFEQAAHEIVGFFVHFIAAYPAEGFVQTAAQAGFQFGGGGFGEGNHQYFVHRQLFQQDQAGEEGGDAVGFAGAGGGFD